MGRTTDTRSVPENKKLNQGTSDTSVQKVIKCLSNGISELLTDGDCGVSPGLPFPLQDRLLHLSSACSIFAH